MNTNQVIVLSKKSSTNNAYINYLINRCREFICKNITEEELISYYRKACLPYGDLTPDFIIRKKIRNNLKKSYKDIMKKYNELITGRKLNIIDIYR